MLNARQRRACRAIGRALDKAVRIWSALEDEDRGAIVEAVYNPQEPLPVLMEVDALAFALAVIAKAPKPAPAIPAGNQEEQPQ